MSDPLHESIGDSARDAPITVVDGEPAAEQAEMTPAQLAEAKRYGRWQLYLDLADSALDLAYIALFALLLAKPLDAWLSPRIATPTLRLLALFGIMFLVHQVISLPLAYFSGFVVERWFALGRQTFARWLVRHLKRLALATLFSFAMVLTLYALCWYVGAWWWLVAAVGFFAVSVVLGQLAPILILPLFYKIEPLVQPELTERLSSLARETNLSIEGVYRMVLSDETAKANAMLTGLGRTRRVLLGDTLLDGFTLDEIEVVFAHEIGHHVYGHIPKLMAVGFFYSLAGFFACDRALALWIGAAYDPSQLPVFALPMLLLVLAVFSLLLVPVQNIVSRRFERQCDRYALMRTGLREAYISAFQKLARLNKDDPDPPRLAVLLFHSHPPIRERIEMANP